MDKLDAATNGRGEWTSDDPTSRWTDRRPLGCQTRRTLLEPDAVKVARPVLRRARRREAPGLSDQAENGPVRGRTSPIRPVRKKSSMRSDAVWLSLCRGASVSHRCQTAVRRAEGEVVRVRHLDGIGASGLRVIAKKGASRWRRPLSVASASWSLVAATPMRAKRSLSGMVVREIDGSVRWLSARLLRLRAVASRLE